MQPTTPPNCRICPYQKTCFFYVLDNASKKEWIRLRRARMYHKGEVVFHYGDEAREAYIVCDGKVKMSKTTKMGRMLTTKILPPGSLFGHRSLIAEEPYSSNAEAFVDSIVSKIDAHSFKGFLRRHWPAVNMLLRQFAKGVREGEDKAVNVAFSSARARLAQALLTFSKKIEGVTIVTTPHKELAQIVGIVPETCARLIKHLEEKGFLKRKKVYLGRRAVELVNIAALERVAGSVLNISQ